MSTGALKIVLGIAAFIIIVLIILLIIEQSRESKQKQELVDTQTSLQSKITELNQISQQLEAESVSLQAAKSKLETLEKVQSTDSKILANQMNDLNQQISTCQSQLKDKINQYNTAQSKSTSLQTSLNIANTSLTSLQSQVDKYKSLLATKSKIIYEQTFPNRDFLGSGQGAYFEQVCPKDQIVIGFKGHAGQLTRGVGIKCGGSSFRYTDNAEFYPAGYETEPQFESSIYDNGFNSLGVNHGENLDGISLLKSDDPTSVLEKYGGRGGSYDTLKCQNDSKIVGIKGRIGVDAINGIGIKCGSPKTATFSLD